MPSPIKSQYHIDTFLTNISVAYLQSDDKFAAGQCFPQVPVQKETDKYAVYSKEDFFRDEAEERRRGTESAGGGYELTYGDYSCRTYAYHKDVTDEDRANCDKPMDADVDATDFVSQKMIIKRETVWGNAYFKAGVWGTNYVGAAVSAAPWDKKYWSSSGSTPIQDVSDAQLAVQGATGYRCNVLVLGMATFYALKNHADILERIKYSQRGVVTVELLATLFEVDKVVIAGAVKNSAARGATASTAFILGKHAFLCYANPAPSLKKPSAGYIFAWTGLLGAGAFGNTMYRIPTPLLGRGSERIEGEMSFDCKVVATELGVFFGGIVA